MEQCFCEKVLEEINFARQDPQKYSIKLRLFKTNFKGVNLILGEKEIETKEGAAAFEEAAHFLDGMDAVGELAWSSLLHKAVEETLEQYKSHTPKIKEVNVDDIIMKYGDPHGEYANQMDYGCETPEMVVMNLLADDGDKVRTNRDIILNPQFKVAAISSGIDKYDRRMTVIFYATLFKECTKEQSKHQDLDMELPPGVQKMEREEKIFEEKGEQKKLIKITKTMTDGSVKTEIFKENV